ncbi:MAG TPA: hypothetical protein DEB06_01460 [Phycisphaerales bacterium]|nr:hypothetical protein [Phycisphaerales bacterium]
MKHLFASLGLAFLLFGGLVTGAAGQSEQVSPPPAASGDEIARRIDEFQSHFDSANRLSGVLLIARGDEIILHRAYAMAHLGLGVPNTTGTRMGIASITKIMTSIVMARLIGAGVISPDDPVSKWLPDFPRGNEITLAHLARHRAGIRHRVTSSGDEALPLSSQDVVDRAAGHSLLFEPGTASSYSSAGYTVLVRCLELASGRSYAELLREFIFEPAGMNDSLEPSPGREVPGMAQSYVPGRGELWPAPKKDLSYLSGAGSVVSTPADLLKFVQALRTGALEVRFDQLAREGRVGWTGASNGWFAFLDVHPEDDLTCIWAGNSWGECSTAMRDALAAICRGEQPTPVVHPDTVPTPPLEALNEYVGAYESRPGATNEVRILGGELWYADSVVLPIGEDRFWHQGMHCELAFVRDETGAVIAVERRSGSSTTRLPKAAPASAP